MTYAMRLMIWYCCTVTQLKKMSVCEIGNKKRKLSRNKERKKRIQKNDMKNTHNTKEVAWFSHTHKDGPWTTFPDISELVASSKVLLHYLTPRSFHASAAQWQVQCQNQATIVSSFVICVRLRITNHTTSIIEIYPGTPFFCPSLNKLRITHTA